MTFTGEKAMKYTVELERRFWQEETLTLEVEATSLAEAKKLAKQKMLASAELDGWEPSDSGYDKYSVADVYPQ